MNDRTKVQVPALIVMGVSGSGKTECTDSSNAASLC